MVFEFLIAYRQAHDVEIVAVIRDCLAKVLEDNLNEFDDEAVARMVMPRLERRDDLGADDESGRRVLFGFALDLPEETASPRLVVDEFVDALNTDPVVHLVKFDDPLTRSDLARWADEIYALEMKLRRVLSLVYLHAYEDGDPYDMLREESVQPVNKDQSKTDNMRRQAENQFFHLTFSQYIDLNRRPEFKYADLLKLIRDKEAYESFREELSRTPVEDEADAELLAGLKERMDAVEAMRNCCAHSRRPSKKVEENYRNARPLLDQLLDSYLVRWEWQESAEEMFWERHAREAVENAIERASWDDGERTITLFDADDRIHRSVASREELFEYLQEVARNAFYNSVPISEGEPIAKCDEYGIVEGVFLRYEEKLRDFFGDDDDSDL